MRTPEELTKRAFFELQSQTEDRLAELLINGVSKAAITLEYHADGSTKIVVDGIPDSEFYVSTTC